MSGTTRTLQANIVVKDQTGAAMAAIAARFRAVAGMNGMQRIHASALQAQRGIGHLAGTLRGLAGSMGRVTAWSGIASGAAVGGLLAMANGAVNAGGRLADLSERLGMSVEDIQGYGFAFEQAGVESEQFTAAMERLQKGIGEAAAGGNQELAGMFRRMGISLRDSQGNLRQAADILPQVAQAMERNGNATTRTRIAMTAFGRAGGPMITALAGGRDALAQQAARWRELNGQITGQTVGALDRLGDGLNEVRHALLGWRDAIAVRLAPILAPLASQLATWVAANWDLIATRVSEWVTAIADAVRAIDFNKLSADINGFLSTARRIYEAIGGWRTIAIAAGLYFAGPLIGSIGLLGLAVSRLLIPPLRTAAGLLARLAAPGLAAAVAGAAPAAPATAAAAGRAAAAARVAGTAVATGAGAAVGATALPLLGAFAAAQALTAAEDPAIRQDNTANGRRRFGQRGGAGGFYAPAPAAPPPQGEVRVRVDFENVPPGARVTATGGGTGVRAPEVDVGYARLGAGG